VDRASLTHNSTQAIRNSLELIRSRMKDNAKFIGIDWFSTRQEDFKLGEQAEDPFTKTRITQGSFTGVGRVHFSDQEHLTDLFKGFHIEVLEHKLIERSLPSGRGHLATWNFCAIKK
jgi:hypothetical protein